MLDKMPHLLRDVTLRRYFVHVESDGTACRGGRAVSGSNDKKINEQLDNCYRIALELLLLGKVQPGNEIGQKVRQEHFSGVTAATFERCLVKLIHDGLAYRTANRTMLVRNTVKRRQTSLATRLVAEASVIRSLAVNKSDLKIARDANDRLRTLAVDADSYGQAQALAFVIADREFHLSLARADENRTAEQVISAGYFSLLLMLPEPLPQHHHLGSIIEEHDLILAGIESGDWKTTTSHSYRHLSAAVGRWMKTMPEYADTVLRDILRALADAPDNEY
ncbi:MAG: FCD domain-containing protein [Planctomycetota bacterium]